MKLTGREKILLVVLAIIVAGAAYYMLFFKAYTKETAKMSSEINVLNKTVTDYELKANMLDSMQKNVDRLRSDVDKYVSENLNKGYNPADLIVYIQKILTDNSAGQLSVGLNNPIKNQYFGTAEVSISFTASYNSAKAVISNIENGQYKQFVRSISFDGRGSAGGPLIVNITFSQLFDDATGSGGEHPYMDNGQFNNTDPFKG